VRDRRAVRFVQGVGDFDSVGDRLIKELEEPSHFSYNFRSFEK
jgi:hypothetical protein